MSYTINYFIKKFEAIPDNDFGTSCLANHCALHHLGVTTTPDGAYKPTEEALMFGQALNVEHAKFCLDLIWFINDGGSQKELQRFFPEAIWANGKCAKERILNSLYKAREQKGGDIL